MKKKLLKLTETQAKLLEILLTVFGIILIIIFGISLGLNFPSNQERIGNFVRVLIFLLTIGWLILVINFGDIIKIEERNIKSKKFDVKCSSFYSLKNSLSKFLSKKEYKDIFTEICPESSELFNMIHVYETNGMKCWTDAVSNRTVCGIEE